MACALWSGSISFGLVNVPVKAYAAVRDHEVHFNQLEKGTGARIHYRKVSDKSGREVPAEKIEQGFEIGKGNYVVVNQDELDELKPRTTKSIDIADFVDISEIDPVYYERTYWLAPDGPAAERAYHLLVVAMEDKHRVGIGTVVMRNKQYLAAIRPIDHALAMSTMRFADEVVPKSSIDALPSGRSRLDPKETKLAAQIIDSLANDWDPKRYHDTYTEELKNLIERKAKGKEIVAESEAVPETKVLDLMQALEASLDAARKGTAKGNTSASRSKPGGRKAPASRKSA
jgi:DNA end-binding protein Ku